MLSALRLLLRLLSMLLLGLRRTLRLLLLLLRLLCVLRLLLRLLGTLGLLLLGLLGALGLSLLRWAILLLGRASPWLPLLVLRLSAVLFLFIALPVFLCVSRKHRCEKQRARGDADQSNESHDDRSSISFLSASVARSD
jgi:hypothetical protein